MNEQEPIVVDMEVDTEFRVDTDVKQRLVYCRDELPGPMGIKEVNLKLFYPAPESGDYAFGSNGNFAVVSSINEQTAVLRGCGQLFQNKPEFEDVTDDYNNSCDESEVPVIDWLLDHADGIAPSEDGEIGRVMVRNDRIAPDYAVYFAEFSRTKYKMYDANAFEWKEAIEMNVREVSFEGGDSEGDNTLRFYRYLNGELMVQWHVYFPEGKKVYDTPVSVPTESVAEAISEMTAEQTQKALEDLGGIAEDQGIQHAGAFLVVGNNGKVTPVEMSAWQGGNYGS